MKTLTFVFLLAGIPSNVFGLCPRPVPKVCSAYFEHDVVFVGSVESKRWSDEYLSFRLRVSRVLRGKVGQTADVYTGNDSARLLWDVGREYVVFARYANGRLESSNDCGPLSDSARVSETVSEIGALRGAQDAVIEGVVLAAQPDGPGVAGVKVEVRGSGPAYQTKSNSKGLLAQRLPPGRYEVIVDPAVARPSDYGWVALDRIVLEPGQCAQLQFVAN